MQLKEAYYRRIQDEKNHQTELKNSKKQNPLPVGSARLGRYNYHPDDRFFTQYKVRDSVKVAKRQVKDWVQPDILDLKKKKWNISNSVPKSFEEDESQRQKILKIKLGFSDFGPVAIKKPNKIYEGTESRDCYANWNVSTFATKKEKEDGQLITNLNSFENSIKFNDKLKNYQKPTQRYEESIKMDKSQFLSHSQVIDDFQKSFKFFNPDSSPQKIKAITHKFFDQKKRQSLKKQISDYDTQDSFGSSFKAKLTKSQKQKINYFYFHTGKWQKMTENKRNNDGYSSDEQQYCWSCCMNSERDSRGCGKRLIDGNRYNFSSFNNP